MDSRRNDMCSIKKKKKTCNTLPRGTGDLNGYPSNKCTRVKETLFHHIVAIYDYKDKRANG